MTGEEIQVIGCGRTDTGVHADKYIANFKTNSTKKLHDISKYLHEFLPEDISVTSLSEASDRFHSRLNVISKTYVYTIDNNKFANVFLKKYAYHVEGKLNIEKMIEASKYLIGTHDFKSFSGVKDKSKKSTIRTINYINITEEDNIIKIEYNGNGFLLNMVRILSGTLIKVAKGEIEPLKVKELLEEKNKKIAQQKLQEECRKPLTEQFTYQQACKMIKRIAINNKPLAYKGICGQLATAFKINIDELLKN